MRGRYAALVLAEGDRLRFTLTSDSGDRVRLSDLRGKPVVSTSIQGRTRRVPEQAAHSRRVRRVFDARVRCVRRLPDDEGSHAKFKNKYELRLTGDTTIPSAEQYGRLEREVVTREEVTGCQRRLSWCETGTSERHAQRQASHACGHVLAALAD